MAIYPNQQDLATYAGAVGKTHTGLVISEGAAPAEQFMVSKTNTAAPFIYEYGPEGNQTVLIAKGKIVEAVGEEVNREVRHAETAIRVAQPGSIRAIGVNHHNVYEQRRDAMEGNRPTVLTRQYIKVPLFEHSDVDTASASAKAMHFGAAYGETKELSSGDFVMTGNDGNFVKYDGTDFRKVVGQVLNVNRELPPAGFLQYYTGLKNTELESYLKEISATPAATDGGYPYGAPYSVGAWRKEFLKSLGYGTLTGIPFLTDGYFSAQKLIEVELDSGDVENVAAGEGATITGKDIAVSEDAIDAAIFVKMKHKIDPRKTGQIEVTYEDQDDASQTVSKRDIHLDLENNMVVIYLDGGVTAKNVSIKVASVVNPKAGIPTEWDYAGSVGAASILLLR